MELSNIYEMTPLQQGLLIESQKHKGNYVSRMIVYLKKEINYEILKESIKLLIEENEILRTRFVFGKNKKNISAIYNNIDLNDYIGTKDDYNIFPHQSFDFEESKNKLIWSHHHALLDGWSVTLLLNRLNEIYFEVQENNYKDRNAPQFLGYINWLNNQNKSEAKHYWNQKIDSLQSPTLIKKQNSINKSKFKQYNFKLEKDISHKIKQVVKNNRWTMNDLIQTIWAITLSCVIGKNNFSYGIVSSGRNPEIDRVGEIAGLFINTIPQVIDLKKHKKFKDLIEYVRRSQNESQKYEYLSLTEIKRNSHMKDSKELFNTLFVYENYPELSTNENMIFDKIEGKEQAHYPLVFSAGYKNELICKISYNQEYLSKKQVESIEKIFKFYAEKLSKEIDLPIENTKYEHKQNEIFGQSTSSKLSLKSKFYNTSRQNHNKVAIKNQNISLTYKQLNNIILNNIKKINENYDINKINTIGIQYSRGVKAIIGMLTATILKIPYVIIDPQSSDKRNSFIIQDAQVDLILSDTESNNKLPCVSISLDESEKGNTITSKERESSNELSHYIYTSGSTGQPKGVKITYKNILSLVENDFVSTLNMKEVTHASSISFDASTFEIWFSLLNGLTINIIDNPLESYDWLTKVSKKHHTTSWFTVGLFNLWVDQNIKVFENIDTIIVGGDKLSEKHINKLQECYPEKTVINGYGPTETTTFTCMKILDTDTKHIPIGKPIANRKTLILNENMTPTIDGFEGELYIGGTGVAAGYLNQPNLTRESFIQNPYNKQKDIIYKTGDIVKRLPNGELQFIGRKDKQVKIRGFRIELDGIKHEALKIDNVDDIVITTDEDHQTKKLYLFYKGKANEQYIRHYLRQVLPDYMIPHFIVKVDTFPLTVNGKINIKMLIEKEKISINNSEVNENASQLHETDIIINIWRKILSVEDISTDNDFYELGGDSLLASRMLHLVKQQLGIKIPIKEFLKNPTINSLISSESYKKLKETREVNYNYKNLKPLINENILLTGSNGFLGIHLLNELSKEQNCIYCLVRAKSRTEAKLKLSDSIKKYKLNVNLESDKIKVIVGDIASENLGLPEEEYNLLSATISKIYNCAANVNFMETISNALKTNFYGVINLVAFSENVYKKELHHISTLASLQDADRNKLLTEDYFSTDDRLFDIGYDYSKFKAENYLSKVLKYRNDIFIYRLGRLSGSTFACKNPKSDLLWLLIKTIVETKMIPKDFSGNFEIAPVDKVAENIIYLSSTKKQNVFHLYNNNENTYEELFSILPKRNYRVLDYRDWIENLKNIQIDHPLKPLMPLFDEDIIKQTFTRYSNDKTNEILKDKCYEKVSIQILKNYMEEFTND